MQNKVSQTQLLSWEFGQHHCVCGHFGTYWGDLGWESSRQCLIGLSPCAGSAPFQELLWLRVVW